MSAAFASKGISGIHSGPVPRHDIEVWFGVYGPRACRLLGQIADGWIPSLGRFSIDQLRSRNEIIDESADAAGRNPADIRRLINISGKITDGESNGPLKGPTDQWVEELGSLVMDHGFDTFVFWPDGDPIGQAGRFGAVAREVRSLVESARG